MCHNAAAKHKAGLLKTVALPCIITMINKKPSQTMVTFSRLTKHGPPCCIQLVIQVSSRTDDSRSLMFNVYVLFILHIAFIFYSME